MKKSRFLVVAALGLFLAACGNGDTGNGAGQVGQVNQNDQGSENGQISDQGQEQDNQTATNDPVQQEPIITEPHPPTPLTIDNDMPVSQNQFTFGQTATVNGVQFTLGAEASFITTSHSMPEWDGIGMIQVPVTVTNVSGGDLSRIDTGLFLMRYMRITHPNRDPFEYLDDINSLMGISARPENSISDGALNSVPSVLPAGESFNLHIPFWYDGNGAYTLELMQGDVAFVFNVAR